MENSSADGFQIDIFRTLKSVLGKSPIILFIACIFFCAAYKYEKGNIAPSYSSSGKIYILDREEKEIKLSIDELNIGIRLVEDYKAMITSRLVLETVIKRLNLDITYETLKSYIVITNPEETRIIEIQLYYDDVENISRILNTIEDVTCNELADKLRTEHPSVLERACKPIVYYKSSPVKVAAICAFLVILVLSGMIGVADIVNSKIRYKKEVEKYLNIQLLTTVPFVSPKLKKGKK